MRQKIEVMNLIDQTGNTTGGWVKGVGIDIHWQQGPLGRGCNRKDANGAFVEGVLEAALQRLQVFQESKFKCRENALAITKIEEALHWLDARTRNRELRQIEGTHET